MHVYIVCMVTDMFLSLSPNPGHCISVIIHALQVRQSCCSSHYYASMRGMLLNRAIGILVVHITAVSSVDYRYLYESL
jgi:hypothetical protein